VEIFDVMGTARAMRYLRDDPVPDELIQTLVWAATRAPSPGNSQLWHFVLVRDRSVLLALGDAVQQVQTARTAGLPPPSDPSEAAIRAGAKHLIDNLARVPLLVVVAAEVGYPPSAPNESYVASTALPAAQNLVLAARALGLGATFTTFHNFAPDEFREVLRLPGHVRVGAVIPVGWPLGSFGPVRRRPTADVVHFERWGGTETGASAAVEGSRKI
jgi:nitroreductase